MFIDIHGHAYRNLTYPCNEKIWVTPEKLIEFYDRHQIERGVLMPMVGPECVLPQSNEEILEAAENFPGRFIPFCNVHPRAISNDPQAPLENLMEHYKKLGCKGIGEVTCNMSFFDPYVENFFRSVEKTGLPVTLHLAHRIGCCYGIYDEPGLPGLTETLLKFPKLRILGHSQVFWAEISILEMPGDRMEYPKGKVREGTVPKLLRKFKNLYGDLSAGSGANALKRDPDYAVKFLNEFQDQLCFGMDICLDPTEDDVKLACFLLQLRDEGKISDGVFQKVARENAIRILNI